MAAVEVWLDSKWLFTTLLYTNGLEKLKNWNIDDEFKSAIARTRSFYKPKLDNIPDEKFTLKGTFMSVSIVDVPVGTYKREYST